jgi:hypothetical protein
MNTQRFLPHILLVLSLLSVCMLAAGALPPLPTDPNPQGLPDGFKQADHLKEMDYLKLKFLHSKQDVSEKKLRILQTQLKNLKPGSDTRRIHSRIEHARNEVKQIDNDWDQYSKQKPGSRWKMFRDEVSHHLDMLHVQAAKKETTKAQRARINAEIRRFDKVFQKNPDQILL